MVRLDSVVHLKLTKERISEVVDVFVVVGGIVVVEILVRLRHIRPRHIGLIILLFHVGFDMNLIIVDVVDVRAYCDLSLRCFRVGFHT